MAHPSLSGDSLAPDAWRWAARRVAAGDSVGEIAATLRLPVAVLAANLEGDGDFERLVAVYRQRRALGQEARLARAKDLLLDAFEMQLEGGKLTGLSWVARLLFGGGLEKLAAPRPAPPPPRPRASVSPTRAVLERLRDEARILGLLPDPPPANDVAAGEGHAPSPRPSPIAKATGEGALSGGSDVVPPLPQPAPRLDRGVGGRGRGEGHLPTPLARAEGVGEGGKPGPDLIRAEGLLAPSPVRSMGEGGDEGSPLSPDLEARLDRLLAQEKPEGEADLDLAEAVCAVLIPHWPAYGGPLDLDPLRHALAARASPGRA